MKFDQVVLPSREFSPVHFKRRSVPKEDQFQDEVMSYSKKIKRLLAGLIAVTFFTTNTLTPSPLAYAATEVLAHANQVQNFEIPAELGKVHEIIFGSPNAPVLLHVQEAHANYDAQKNIRDILRFLSENYNIKEVYLEGAGYELRPDSIDLSGGDAELRRTINDRLLRVAELTGAEAYLMESAGAMKGYGVEEAAAYRAVSTHFKVIRAATISKFLSAKRIAWQKQAGISQ